MRYCETCKTTYAPDISVCPKDHGPTTELSLAQKQDPFLNKSVGSYQIIERLGVGGMGVVYKAKHSTLGRFGAVKFLAVDQNHPQLAERFLVEAKLLSQLDHPHIVGIYDFGILEGTPYYLMEYLEGDPLAKRLQQKSPLPLEEAIEITLQLLDALQTAHQAGIIHRDIKPDNIILKKKEGSFIKLFDFGIAKSLHNGPNLTQSGAIMGTPQYLSPEQAQGEANIDARADLYSVGVVLFEMACGRLPFIEQNFAMLLMAHISQTAPLATRLNPSLPKPLEDILVKALQKPKEARYQDAAEMMRDLKRVLQKAPASIEDLPTLTPQKLQEKLTQESAEPPDTIRLPGLEEPTIQLEPTEPPILGLSKTFGRYCSYEHVSKINALHISYQYIWVEDEFVANAMQEELLELLEIFGRSWLVICFDNTEFNTSGAEALAHSLEVLSPKAEGMICYISRPLPRFVMLGDQLQKKGRGPLLASKERAIQELLKQTR